MLTCAVCGTASIMADTSIRYNSICPYLCDMCHIRTIKLRISLMYAVCIMVPIMAATSRRYVSVCPYCDKPLSQACHRTTHILERHSANLAYVCPYCPFTSSRRSFISKHIDKEKYDQDAAHLSPSITRTVYIPEKYNVYAGSVFVYLAKLDHMEPLSDRAISIFDRMLATQPRTIPCAQSDGGLGVLCEVANTVLRTGHVHTRRLTTTPDGNASGVLGSGVVHALPQIHAVSRSSPELNHVHHTRNTPVVGTFVMYCNLDNCDRTCTIIGTSGDIRDHILDTHGSGQYVFRMECCPRTFNQYVCNNYALVMPMCSAVLMIVSVHATATRRISHE